MVHRRRNPTSSHGLPLDRRVGPHHRDGAMPLFRMRRMVQVREACVLLIIASRTPPVYKDVKRELRAGTWPRFHVPRSGAPLLNNAITQELWQLNDTLCIIIRLCVTSSASHRPIGRVSSPIAGGGATAAAYFHLSNKSRFALRRVNTQPFPSQTVTL